MPLSHLTALGTVCAALAMWFLGAFWYSPVAFGTMWMKHVGVTKEAMTGSMQTVIIKGAIAALVQALALGLFLSLFHPSSIREALHVCLAGWAGLQLPIWLHQHIYEQRPTPVLLINGGYGLASALLAGVILQIAA